MNAEEKDSRELLEQQNEMLKKKLNQYKLIMPVGEDMDILSIKALQLYKLLRNNHYPLPLTSSDDWELLFCWTDLSQFNFYSRLVKQYSRLGKHDIKICCLIRLHFTNNHILDILGVQQSTLYTNKSNLRKTLSLKDSLEEFIRAF